MLEVGSTTLVVLFGAWWAVSAWNQFQAGAWALPIRRHVPFNLIPLWTFFAPNPARADSRLIWRQEYGREWSSWQELHFGFAPCSRRWLLNPELVLNKAVADLVSSLLRIGPDLENRTTTLSSSYVAMLNVILSQPRSSECTAIQFSIVRTWNSAGSRSANVVFISEVHAV